MTDKMPTEPVGASADEAPRSADPSSASDLDRRDTDEPSQEGELQRLRRERDEYQDLLLRKTAEFDNYRKRTERERRDHSELAAADLLEELLPIVDDLERALQAEPGGAAEAYRQGVELIHRQLLELLKKRGVTPIETAGARFDPHLHEAVLHEASPAHQDGEIVEEFRRGYRIGERLLRPAMVKVAKA